MTKNQIDYQNVVENRRHNEANEAIGERKNEIEHELGDFQNRLEYAKAVVNADKMGADKVVNAVNAASNVVKAVGSILTPIGAGLVA